MQFSIPTKDRPAAILFACLGVLYAIPLMLADRPYIDDIGRRLNGYLGWSEAGRPLSDLLMILLNLGAPIGDLAPLPQMLAIAIVASCCWLLFRWTERLDMPAALRATASAFFLFNPFLLENLSYRFDSLPMTLSTLVALWALEPGVERPWRALLASTGFVYAALTLYQASLNVALATSLLLLVVEVDAGQAARALGRFGRRLASLVLGYGVYWLTISSWAPLSDYATPHSIPVPLSASGIGRLVSNTVRGLNYIWRSFDPTQQSLLVAPLVAASVFCIVLAMRTARLPGVRFKGLLVPLVVLAPFAMLLLAFGVSSALGSPVYQPRVFMAFGCTSVFFIVFALRGMTGLIGRKRRGFALIVLAGLPAILALTTPFAFSNAQIAQRQFDLHLASRIEAGLDAMEVKTPFTFAVDGIQPFAPVVRREVVRFPIVAKLVPLYLKQWTFAMYYLRSVDIDLRQTNPARAKAAIEAARSLPPGYVGNGFTLTLAGKILVLRFTR